MTLTLKKPLSVSVHLNVFINTNFTFILGSLSKAHTDGQAKKKKCALDEIMEEQERWKAKKQEHNQSSSKAASSSKSWLLPDIVVRVMTKDLGAQFYRKKATVEKVSGEYGAVIEMMEGGVKVKVDEEHLETVVPKEGSRVAVLRGVYRGRRATISSIDVDRERVEVAVENADAGGRTVSLRFDDVSKLT